MSDKAGQLARILLLLGFLAVSTGCDKKFNVTPETNTPFKIIDSSRNIGRQLVTANYTETGIFNLLKQDGEYSYYEVNYVSPFPDFFARNYYLTRTTIDGNGNLNSLTILNSEDAIQSTIINGLSDYEIILNGVEPFLDYVAFGGNYAGGAIGVNYFQSDFKVEIQFGPGKTQKAHRFTVPLGTTSGVGVYDYTFQDYIDVPFEIWDVTNNKQLTVSFRDQARDGAFNLMPFDVSGDPDIQSREYIYVHDIPYSDVPNFDISGTSGGLIINQIMMFWPVLAEGGSWEPTNLPNSSLNISPIFDDRPANYRPTFTPYIRYSYEPDTKNITISNYTFSNDGDELIYLTRFDESLNAIDNGTLPGGVVNNRYTGSMGILKTEDGGTLLARQTTTGFSVYKLKNDYSVEYSTLNVAVTNGDILIPWTEFFESNGSYSFFINTYNVDGDINSMHFYDFSETGITQISSLQLESGTAPYLPVEVRGVDYFDWYIINESAHGPPTYQYLTQMENGYALLTTKGQVYLLDQKFVQVGSQIQIPDFNPGTIHNNINIYSVDDRLFVAGAPGNNLGTFVIVSIDGNGSIKSNTIEFTDVNKTVQNISYMNPDGSGIHLILMETSTKSRELMYFKTDPYLELILE